MAMRIIELMPEHTHYVEPFAGGLSVLFAKHPDGVSEVINDLDGELINFYDVLKDPQLFDQFYRRVEVTPFSQDEFRRAVKADSSDRISRNRDI